MKIHVNINAYLIKVEKIMKSNAKNIRMSLASKMNAITGADGLTRVEMQVRIEDEKILDELTVWFDSTRNVTQVQLGLLVLVKGISLNSVDEIILELILDLIDKNNIYSVYEKNLNN